MRHELLALAVRVLALLIAEAIVHQVVG